ncbi:MAG TPA: crosslink repair DNA glycosylase YcaQ family protein, partial [Thermomicrobiales bacterium]|nr:crosslink repair DNA glycosylase YcaQ family protein [Thermomicrobiales bacterium]
IEREGPAGSRHFERPGDGRRAEQWEWYGLKPERRALDALWIRGELVLRQREPGFGRVFDLPDRVIPGFWDAPALGEREREREMVLKAVDVLGVGTAGWVTDYFRTGGPSHVSIARSRVVLASLEVEGLVNRVVIPGIDEPVWTLAEREGLLSELRAGRKRPVLTTLLSPFDNLVWNRDRDERLFDFHYRLECYTPAPKRTYGYYSLPILHRGKVVGRLDPSYDRRKRFLTIRALHLEPWVKPGDAMFASIRAAIEDLVGFLGGPPGNWVLQRSEPGWILSHMQPHLEPGAIDEPA